MKPDEPIGPDATPRIIRQVDGETPARSTVEVQAAQRAGGASSAKRISVGNRSLRLRDHRVASGVECASPHFEVLGPLGQGGMGVVAEARQVSCDRVVALKQLRPDRIDDEHRQRLIMEAALTASLEHPCIPAVYEIGRNQDGDPFYAMRRIQGESWVSRIDRMSLHDNLQVLLRITEAVAYAHEQGVIHRDIKPDNVMLGEFGEVLLVDWGFAAAAPDAAHGGNRHAERITAENVLVGSPGYMPPETARGDAAAITLRSDVYLLGASLRRILTGRRPHPGESNDDRIQAAVDNVFDGVLPLGPLGDLAARATRTDPAERTASAREFAAALRLAMQHREAAELVQGALRTIEQGGHEAYLQAESLLRQAATMRPDDVEVGRTLSRVRRHRAGQALDSGDLALAAQLVDPHDVEADGLRSAITEALNKRRRNRRLYIAAVIALAGLLAFGSWYGLDELQSLRRPWRTIVSASGRAMDGSLVPLGPTRCELAGGTWRLNRNEACRISGPMPRGDLRIEVDARWTAEIDGLEIAFGTQDGIEGDALPVGYAGQIGGWQGSATFLARIAQSRPASIADGVGLPLQVGRWYAIACERMNDRLRIEVDGRPIFERLDPLPPPGQGREVRFRSWADGLELRSVRVLRRGRPETTSSLDAVDALVEFGHVQDAVEECLAIAADAGNGDLTHRALAKACVLSASSDQESVRQRGAEARRLLQSSPGGANWLATVLSADAVSAWLDDRTDAAVVGAIAARKLDPGSRALSDLLALPRRQLPSATAARLLGALAATPGLTALDLDALGITDVGPLTGSHLQRLSLSGNPITDLSPLRGMRLVSLNLRGTKVGDLSPLAGMPIRQLMLDDCQVSDLGPLRGAPLEVLIAPRIPLTDLTPLADLPLRELVLSQSQVADLRPLAGACRGSLETLLLDYTKVVDLAPLATFNRLQRLDLDHAAVESIAPLRGLALTRLVISSTRVADLAALSGMPLHELEGVGCPIRDLAPLAGAPLELLRVPGTQISDLAPVSASPLRTVNVQQTRVSDLSPLPASVGEILAWGCPIVEPPRHCPGHLATAFDGLEDAEWHCMLDRLVDMGLSPANLRELRAMRGLLRNDLECLRAAADDAVQPALLHIPVRITWEQARELTRRLGGRMAVPATEVEALALAQRLPASRVAGDRKAWIGLLADANGVFADVDGADRSFRRAPTGSEPGTKMQLLGLPRGVVAPCPGYHLREVFIELPPFQVK